MHSIVAKTSGTTRIALLLGVMLLGACAAKRDTYDVPRIHLPERYAQAPTVVDATLAATAAPGDVASLPSATVAASGVPASQIDTPAAAQPATQPIPATPLSATLPEWWRMLGSEELNHLVDRALANNHDLRIASLRVAQLKARMEIAGADKLPTLTLPIRSETNYPAWGIGNPNNNNRSRSIHQISLRADWRPDLWGEYASLYESAEFQLMRATYQRDDMQRIVAARIAADYLEYLSLNDRLRATRQTEKTLREMFESVKVRLEIGDATITELEQQRAAGYAVRATIPVLEQQRVVLHNRIASFAGTVPEELKLSGQGMDSVTFPAVLPGAPSTLLLRRPDVRAIEARLLAADADIDVARARLLPPLDLTAQAGYGSLYLSRLFSSPTLWWQTIANLSITLFDSSKRDNEVKFAKAVHEEMVETYIRTLYDAVREVDDALGAIRHMNKQLEEQSVATESSFRAWNYSLEAYHAGALDYLVVLDTERTYHRHLDDLYRFRMERYRGLVDLFSALGGGIHMGDKLPGSGYRPEPMPDEVDYGVVLDAVVAGLHPLVNPAPLGYDHVPVPLSHAANAPPQTAPSPALEPPADDNHETGHNFKDPLIVAQTSTEPAIGQTDGIDWDGNTLRENRDHWLIELFGTFDRSAIFPVWRDLRARFPQLTDGRTLLPRQQDNIQINEMERLSWYRLFVSSFPDRHTAEQACATLRAGTRHCGIVSSRVLRANDPFNANRTLKESSTTEPAPHAPRPSAPDELQSPAPKSVDEKISPAQPEIKPAQQNVTPPSSVFIDDKPAAQEYWLVELPPVHDQRAIATAWRDLLARFPTQMKIRTLLTREQNSSDTNDREQLARYQLFIAKFQERPMAVEFCSMLHAAGQACNVLSSHAFAQTEALEMSWSTSRSFIWQKEAGQ